MFCSCDTPNLRVKKNYFILFYFSLWLLDKSIATKKSLSQYNASVGCATLSHEPKSSCHTSSAVSCALPGHCRRVRRLYCLRALGTVVTWEIRCPKILCHDKTPLLRAPRACNYSPSPRTPALSCVAKFSITANFVATEKPLLR